MLLTDLLTVEQIRIPLESRAKVDILRELVHLATDGLSAEKREHVLSAVMDRESILSTGIGHGVAIPHGKSSLVPSLRMVAGRSAEPIEFAALDGQPVQLFFLLIGPESDAGPHIKALSRISRLVRRDDLRELLVDAPDARAFLRLLQTAEEQAA